MARSLRRWLRRYYGAARASFVAYGDVRLARENLNYVEKIVCSVREKVQDNEILDLDLENVTRFISSCVSPANDLRLAKNRLGHAEKKRLSTQAKIQNLVQRHDYKKKQACYIGSCVTLNFFAQLIMEQPVEYHKDSFTHQMSARRLAMLEDTCARAGQPRYLREDTDSIRRVIDRYRQDFAEQGIDDRDAWFDLVWRGEGDQENEEGDESEDEGGGESEDEGRDESEDEEGDESEDEEGDEGEEEEGDEGEEEERKDEQHIKDAVRNLLKEDKDLKSHASSIASFIDARVIAHFITGPPGRWNESQIKTLTKSLSGIRLAMVEDVCERMGQPRNIEARSKKVRRTANYYRWAFSTQSSEKRDIWFGILWRGD